MCSFIDYLAENHHSLASDVESKLSSYRQYQMLMPKNSVIGPKGIKSHSRPAETIRVSISAACSAWRWSVATVQYLCIHQWQ